MKMKKRRKATQSDSNSPALPLDDHSTYQQILELLREQTQIDVTEYKVTTINRRVQKQMKLQGAADLAGYLRLLERNSEAVKSLADDIFIHVTEFFRDRESFEALKKTVLPRINKQRTPGAPLRVWVPGCATGEEAYSIAISLMETAQDGNEPLPFQVFATDISERAIEKARLGQYGEGELEGISQERLEAFFERTPTGYKVKKAIRDHCIFSKHDLIKNPPFAKIDLISCRNVLIYFDPNLQKQVMPVFHYSLNSKGVLWLGRSEAPTGFAKLFSLEDKTHKFYSKISTAAPMSYRFPLTRVSEKTGVAKKNVTHAPVLDHQKELDRIAASRYAPAGAVINSDAEIINVRGHTAPFLELPTGNPSYNLLKMLKPELLPGVRMAIQAAKKLNAPARKDGLAYLVENRRKKVDVEVVPVNPNSPFKERHYLVFFEEPINRKKKAAAKKRSPARKEKRARKDSKETYISELLEELDALREHQQSIAEGYEASQEELTSSNEELQSTLEEFQSTNEELEAAKEEMQATNEELATVNDELQHRNEELARSEEKFRLLVEGVKEYAIFMLDPNGVVATWNEGARRFKGYEPSEIIGKHFSIFYPDEDRKNDKPGWELKRAATDGKIEDEGWRIRRDGSKFWANVVITRVSDKDGNLLGFSKVTRDLTERKLAEEALREARETLEVRVRERTAELQASEDRLKEFVERSPYAVAMFDKDMRYVFASQKWLTDLKLSERDVRTKSHYELLPEIPDHWKEVHKRCLAGATEKNDEEAFVRADGTTDWLRWEVRPWYVRSGEIGGILIFFEDISHRKQMEESVKESEQRLRTLANTIPQLVWMARSDGFIFWFNRRWYEYTGRTPEEMEGWGWQSVQDPVYLPKVKEKWEESLATGEPFEMEFPLKGADGRFRWFLTRIIPVRDSQGKIVRWFGTNTDIEEQRKIREQLTETLEVRDEFLSIASHELKTPITSLKLLLQIADRGTKPEQGLAPSSEELSRTLKTGLRQIDALTDLVETLLDISKIRIGKFLLAPSEFDLSELVKTLIDQFAGQLKTAKIETELRLAAGLVGYWDQRRLEQVITNLVTNAIKYAPKSKLRLETKRSDDSACLIIQDTGSGIAPERLSKIFDRFERAGASKNVGGLGLGLFIVRQIVDAHQGRIEVESDLGKGTTFYIELPLRPRLPVSQHPGEGGLNGE